MGESSTSAAMCKLCGHRHRMMDPHIWDDEPKREDVGIVADRKATIETLKKSVFRVHNANECTRNIDECVHKPEKAKDVYTVRQVSIRQLRANLAGELRDLPFDIIKSGVVIATVNAKE